jgi:hypothetical protein
MRPLFRILPMLLFPFLSGAQERCASAFHTTDITHTGNATPDLNSEIIIPVVVHVIWRTAAENISDAQIHSQLDALNADFSRKNPDFREVPAIFAGRAANAGIRFVLATADPQGRPTSGIERRQTTAQLWINDDRIKKTSTGGSDPWDSRQYLNIWVANLSSTLIGFSTFPEAPADKDGIVIRYNAFGTSGTLSPPFDRGRTLTHETGHWLGLKHLWGDSPCGDDGVEDTPRQRSGNKGTPQFPRINTGCENGPYGDMFMNFMDFSDDRSLLMFTKGQTDRMRAQFLPGGSRHSLLTSKGAGEPWNLQPDTAPGMSNIIEVFPNPAVHYINIRSSMEMPATFTIIDTNGRLVKSGTLNKADQRIDIGSIKPGMYYLRLGITVIHWIKGS